ncbi:Unknown protein [Striga hermonthica]|uniref:Uncharacterized protein n=1 Tax=Striga hermonthica TaxID=68872 RepID=A0A9N7RGI4_STRHE|nr:Unknown protein [Striga hermonthica]
MNVDPIEVGEDEDDGDGTDDNVDPIFIYTVETSQAWATGEYAEDIGNAASQAVNDGTGVLPDEVEAGTNLGGDEFDWMTSESESRAEGSTSTMKSKGSKRKSTQLNEDMSSVFRDFCTETGARLREIAQKIGYEYDVSAARKEVYSVVGKILGLNMQEKLVLCKLLVRNTEDLELFFSLPDDAKAEFARMKLAGNI